MELSEEIKRKAFREGIALRREIETLQKEFHNINSQLLDRYRAQQKLIDDPVKYFEELDKEELETT